MAVCELASKKPCRPADQRVPAKPVWRFASLRARSLAGVTSTRYLLLGANTRATASLPTDLSRLSGIKRTFAIEVGNNALLASLKGLENIEAIGGYLFVYGNFKLGDCSALARLLDYSDDFEPGPGPRSGEVIPDIGSAISIFSNKTGCNSIEEISPVPKLASILNGSWYDPALSGQGFAVHKIDGDTGIAYFYGFDQSGVALWLIGVWDKELHFGQEMVIGMNQVFGGNFGDFNPANIIEEPWGTLRLRFDNCESGSATLVGADGQQVVDIKVLASSFGLACK